MSNNQEKLNEQLLNVIKSKTDDIEAKLKKAKYLIRLGADVNAKFFGKSILRWLKKDDDVAPEVIEFLKEKGANEWEISKVEAERLTKGFWDENGKIISVEEVKSLVRCGANLGVERSIWKVLGIDEINEILKILPKGYEIDGDVVIRGEKIRKLPDFSKIKVRGDFNCGFIELTTLEGAPSEVGGNFDCGTNKLTTLNGAPRYVAGGFDCSRNRLISLEGAPSKVGRFFYCYHNQLTSLKGAPKDVGSGFVCSYNQLTTLEGAPRYVAGGFDCSRNRLISLEGAPSEVGGNFDCCDNQLTTLEGKPQIIGYEFKIEEEVLAKIEENEKKQKAKSDVNLYVGNEGR